MEGFKSFSTEVWLLSGLFHSLPGILTLKKGTLVFIAIGTGTFRESGLKKLEKKSGAKNFHSLLKEDKPAQLFCIELSEIQKITFPLLYFSAGTHITFNNEKYRLSFIQPNNTKINVQDKSVEVIQDIRHSRKVGKQWKILLTSYNKSI